MKKQLLITILLTVSISFLNAQSQFENASFEEWEDIKYGSVQEPVEWSSVRTATPDNIALLAPAVWDKSEDAHTGNYSLYLTNISIFGIIATGTVTNGRILANLQTEFANSHTNPDTAEWNTPIVHRPDSVIGWYKCKPNGGDFPTLKALLHTGYASLPQQDSSNWIGVAYIELSNSEVSEWTRFSTPFDYFNDNTPEFMLTILTSGNGLTPVADSEAWFDDVQLIYNGTSVNEIAANNLKVYSANGTLNVFVDEAGSANRQLSVSDISGRKVFTGEIRTGENHQFHLNVKNGYYIVSVHSGNEVLTKKVWIQ